MNTDVYLPGILDRFELAVEKALEESGELQEEREKDKEFVQRSKISIEAYLEVKRRNPESFTEEMRNSAEELMGEVKRIEKKHGVIRSFEEEEVFNDTMGNLLNQAQEELDVLLERFQMYVDAKEVGGRAFSYFLQEIGLPRYGLVYDYIDMTSEFARNINSILIRDLRISPTEVYHTPVGEVTHRIWKCCGEFLNELRDEKERHHREEEENNV